MTPLIDVVFILLVFFMLTTRLLPLDRLEIATTERSDSVVTAAEPTPTVRILSGQRLEWNQTTYSLNALGAALQNKDITRINVISMPDASVNDFTLVMSTMNEWGIEPNWMREKPTGARP